MRNSAAKVLALVLSVSHLLFHEVKISAADEWSVLDPGWLFIRVVSGSGYFMAPGQAEAIDERGLVWGWITPSTVFRASQIGDLELQWFVLRSELLEGFLSLAESRFFCEPPKEQPLFTAPPDDPLARRFLQASLSAPERASAETRCQLLALAFALLRERPGLPPGPVAAANGRRMDSGRRFRELVETLCLAEMRGRRTRDLAKMCGCSERHFSRMFRSFFGLSLRSFRRGPAEKQSEQVAEL